MQASYRILTLFITSRVFPGDASVKNPPANAGHGRDMGSIPGSGRSPGGEPSNPLQYSCLENPTDRGAWRAIVHRVTKSQMRLKLLSMHISLLDLCNIDAIYFTLTYFVSSITHLHYCCYKQLLSLYLSVFLHFPFFFSVPCNQLIFLIWKGFLWFENFFFSISYSTNVLAINF